MSALVEGASVKVVRRQVVVVLVVGVTVNDRGKVLELVFDFFFL